jgi:hypothetical protein
MYLFKFMHQDGEGFNIMLQAFPINGKIVLRPPKGEPEAHGTGGRRTTPLSATGRPFVRQTIAARAATIDNSSSNFAARTRATLRTRPPLLLIRRNPKFESALRLCRDRRAPLQATLRRFQGRTRPVTLSRSWLLPRRAAKIRPRVQSHRRQRERGRHKILEQERTNKHLEA